MFNKYFDLVKGLFEAVFKGGEAVKFSDYIQVLLFTFALIALAVAGIAVLFFIVKGPMILHKKLTHKIQLTIKEIDKAVEEQCFDKYPEDTIEPKYAELQSQLVKRNWLFAGLIVLLYIPLVIPTLLFIVSNVLTWF